MTSKQEEQVFNELVKVRKTLQVIATVLHDSELLKDRQLDLKQLDLHWNKIYKELQ